MRTDFADRVPEVEFSKLFDVAASDFIKDYTRYLNRAVELGIPMSSSEGYHRRQISELQDAFNRISHARMHFKALIENTDAAMDRLRTLPTNG